MTEKEIQTIQKWWNSLSTVERHNLKYRYGYYTNYGYGNIRYKLLTNTQLRDIWRKENISNSKSCSNINCIGGVVTFDGQTGRICKKCNPDKSNQKEYKEFDAELFKAYIAKFRPMDKAQACKILQEELKKLNIYI